MKKLIPILLLAILAVGCENGGTGSNPPSGRGTITGQILDINDQPVRGATVAADGKTTTTSTTGAYHFDDVRSGIVEVRAQVRDEGVDYRGRTYASLTAGDQRSNVNIVMGPVGALGRIRGTVRDREGFLLRNVPVFAYSGAGSSARAYTNDDGEYEIEELVSGFDYEVMATGQGYRSDYDVVFVASGGSPRVDLILGTPASPSLTAPQSFSAVTWVSPYPGRSTEGSSALEWARVNAFPKELSSSFRPVQSRSIRDDIAVEAVLTWDEQRFADHQGWAIYRATGGGSLQGLEFNADPLSAFFQDVGLNTATQYRYAATTLSSNYPANPGQTESPLSAVQTVSTLERLSLNSVPSGTTTPTFSWPGGSRAAEFVVYVFDRKPIIGVTEIWRSSFTGGSSISYSGPSLVRGRRYYAFVLGLANSRTSRTISEIEEFTP
jgi:hypothetical protein